MLHYRFVKIDRIFNYNELAEFGSQTPLSAKWLQDDFKMVVKTAFKISVNRCKTYTYNDFSLCISLHSEGCRSPSPPIIDDKHEAVAALVPASQCASPPFVHHFERHKVHSKRHIRTLSPHQLLLVLL